MVTEFVLIGTTTGRQDLAARNERETGSEVPGDWLVPTARTLGTTTTWMDEPPVVLARSAVQLGEVTGSGNGDGWLQGLVDLAIGLSPVGTRDTHDALRHLERDVLDRWRGALQAGDASRVGQLVEIGHAVREAIRLVPPGRRDGLLS